MTPTPIYEETPWSEITHLSDKLHHPPNRSNAVEFGFFVEQHFAFREMVIARLQEIGLTDSTENGAPTDFYASFESPEERRLWIEASSERMIDLGIYVQLQQMLNLAPEHYLIGITGRLASVNASGVTPLYEVHISPNKIKVGCAEYRPNEDTWVDDRSVFDILDRKR